MATTPTRNDVVIAWADMVIKIWLQKVTALNIRHTGDLLNSFVNHVYNNASGDAMKIEFAFAYYGKFVDMGVGKGITLGEAGSDGIRRQPKPWFSKTFLLEVKKLVNMLAENYAEETAVYIVQNLDDNSNLHQSNRI